MNLPMLFLHRSFSCRVLPLLLPTHPSSLEMICPCGVVSRRASSVLRHRKGCACGRFVAPRTPQRGTESTLTSSPSSSASKSPWNSHNSLNNLCVHRSFRRASEALRFLATKQMPNLFLGFILFIVGLASTLSPNGTILDVVAVHAISGIVSARLVLSGKIRIECFLRGPIPIEVQHAIRRDHCVKRLRELSTQVPWPPLSFVLC